MVYPPTGRQRVGGAHLKIADSPNRLSRCRHVMAGSHAGTFTAGQQRRIADSAMINEQVKVNEVVARDLEAVGPINWQILLNSIKFSLLF